MNFINDNMSITVYIEGYTEKPEVFIDEKEGRNALDCTVAYVSKDPFLDGVMWDEIFKTDGIACLYSLVFDLLRGKTDKMAYKDEWENFILNVYKKTEDLYELHLSILQRSRGSYLNGTFDYTKDNLKELADELQKYTELYPVIE
ncbi:MAG: hypothetical protein II997_05520 [Clostridia bacterium]|nr:hypothetical protein [Clostridia bacterium]